MARLENWSIFSASEDNPYLAPEQRTYALKGTVYGHPNEKFQDGDVVSTSVIVEVDGRKVKTRNTEYVLGAVDSSYIQWYKENGDGKFDFESDTPLDPIE